MLSIIIRCWIFCSSGISKIRQVSAWEEKISGEREIVTTSS